MKPPPLALTMGDPAGVSAEITAGAWRALRGRGPAFVVLADPAWLAPHAPVHEVAWPDATHFAHAIPVLAVKLTQAVMPGHPDRVHAPAILASIEQAVQYAQSGAAFAVVTNPISKAVLMAAGFPFAGHTEFLGSLTGVPGQEIMMLASPHLRVVPVTIHVSLRRALEMLTTPAIIAAARTTHAALRDDFGIATPRVAIAGLNPHGGENGHLGREEIQIIQPAIDTLRAEGLHVTGPHPPDTMFTPEARGNYDAAICMYHDQALIPLKTLDMWSGVNVTLGLPIVRTSPDHGTGFDIAGKGRANADSLIAALLMADAIGRNRAGIRHAS